MRNDIFTREEEENVVKMLCGSDTDFALVKQMIKDKLCERGYASFLGIMILIDRGIYNAADPRRFYKKTGPTWSWASSTYESGLTSDDLHKVRAVYNRLNVLQKDILKWFGEIRRLMDNNQIPPYEMHTP